MKIEQESHDQYVTLIPEGDLDANSSVYLDEKVKNLISEKIFNVHVRMDKIAYISSAGLGVFISYVDELATNNGKFVLTHVPENVFEVFTILGLNKLDNLKLIKEDVDPAPVFNE
ncbi:MAG: STAS domain-containing protein [Bacteroidota bacterium]